VSGKKWEQLIKAEPRLLKLYNKVKKDSEKYAKITDSFCANDVWYEKYKPRLCLLVGWEAQNKSISDETSYDVAYNTIYELLPNCKNCGCL